MDLCYQCRPEDDFQRDDDGDKNGEHACAFQHIGLCVDKSNLLKVECNKCEEEDLVHIRCFERTKMMYGIGHHDLGENAIYCVFSYLGAEKLLAP